ncbi:MAG: GGDEF domain-containing protein [Chloroflexota bacterium]
MIDIESQHAATERRHRKIRRGVVVVVLVQFVLLMGIAAIQGFWPGGGLGGSTSIAVLFASGLIVPLLIARMVRRILAGVDTLEVEQQQLVELYGRARHESLVDALTGLGNHRAFQEELARQLEYARRHTRHWRSCLSTSTN